VSGIDRGGRGATKSTPIADIRANSTSFAVAAVARPLFANTTILLVA
jgi:hypothetical protein